MNIETNQLFKLLLSEMDELLGNVNTDSASRHYGCAHEAYWKKLEDPDILNLNFSNARWQETAYTFALFYAHKIEGNIYYGDAALITLIKAIFKYWINLQHNDGSFDEWRKEEHGQPPTAFSLYAMSRAYDLCVKYFDEEERRAILSVFQKAAIFLVNNEELVATNHEVVAVAALAAYLRVDNNLERIIRRSIDVKLERISRNFCEDEGWLLEIDGPDTGYNTVSLSYLALYWELTGDARVLAMMGKIVRFNRYFTYSDGLVGGGANSRYSYLNCPLAYMITKEAIGESRALLSLFFNTLNRFAENGKYGFSKYQKGVILYLYLLTVIKAEGGRFEGDESYSLPAGNRLFKKAAILIINTKDIYAAVGRGASLGALYLKNRGRTMVFSSPKDWSNQGCIAAELATGGWVSTLFGKNKFVTRISDASYHCKGSLIPFSVSDTARWGVRKDYEVKTRIFTFIKSFPFALRLGRRFWFKIAKPLKEFMVNAFKDKYTAERDMLLKGENELQFKNSLKAGKNGFKQVFVQETIYHMDDSMEYTYEGAQRRQAQDGRLSFFSDTVFIKDKKSDVKIASFSFESPVKISIQTLDKAASNAVIKHAVGYFTKIRFEASYNEARKEYYLNYTFKIFA